MCGRTELPRLPETVFKVDSKIFTPLGVGMITKMSEELAGYSQGIKMHKLSSASSAYDDDRLVATLAGGGAAAIAVPTVHTLATIPAIPYLSKALGGTKDLSDAESSELVKRMTKGLKHQIHGEVAPHPLFSHYNPATNTVVSNKNSYVFAHELGHASGLLNKHRLGNMLGVLTHSPATFTLRPFAEAARSAQQAYNRAKGLPEEDDSKALAAASWAARLSSAAQLAEEGQASIRGAYHVGKIQGRSGALRAAKAFLPAFGTYAALAGLTHGVAPYIGKRIGQYMAGSEDKNSSTK